MFLLLFEHGQDIPGWIFEPRDRWASVAVNSFLVCFDLSDVVMLENYTRLSEAVDRLLDIVNLKIEDRERGGLMAGLGIYEHVAATRDAQDETFCRFRNCQAECFTVKLFCLLKVINR